ncbi:hypothetical protein NT01EI_1238 [Edwardsiella ictaluri 93-146]|uniref:Uncharacterized protein n=1 Tax=Edwardsiella ictaluri (strain 93-146) TaxID=634503 RepID=C5B7E1_EDWI9|nr:hypothetical protein NT01EI_1238 [Edwardsiella ictaluri 93-146]
MVKSCRDEGKAPHRTPPERTKQSADHRTGRATASHGIRKMRC